MPDDFSAFAAALFPAQHEICRRFGTEWRFADGDSIAGVADDLRGDLQPVNGLRHPLTETTTGWYLWAGEGLSQADDYFRPQHLFHAVGWRPEIERYLGLGAGWRFLIAPGYEDVWYDEALLDV